MTAGVRVATFYELTGIVQMRKKTERVITFMKVDDYEERTGRLTASVESVEQKLGKRVKN